MNVSIHQSLTTLRDSLLKLLSADIRVTDEEWIAGV